MEHYGAAGIAIIYSISRIVDALMFASGLIADTVEAKKISIIIPLVSLVLISPLCFPLNWSTLLLASIGVRLLGIESPAMFSLLIKSVNKKELLGKIVSISRLTISVSLTVSSILFPLILKLYGLKIVVIIMLSLLIICAFLRTALTETLSKKEDSRINVFKQIASLFRKNIFFFYKAFISMKIFVLIVILYSFINLVVNPFKAYYFANVLGIDIVFIGMLYSAIELSEIFLQIPVGFIVDKIGEKKVFLTCFTVGVFLMTIFLFIGTLNPLLGLLIFALNEILSPLYYISYSSYIGKKCPRNILGSFYGGMSSLMGFLMIITPIIGASLWSYNPSHYIHSLCLRQSSACITNIKIEII